MSAIEERLREDLPALAEAMLADRTPEVVAEPIGASGKRILLEVADIDRGSNRHRVLLVAAAASVAMVLLIGTYFRADGSAEQSVEGVAAGSVDSAVSPGEVVISTDAVGTWTSMAEAPIRPRFHSVAAWTGSEAIFWAGSSLSRNIAYTEGATYDPETDTWADLEVPGWGHPGLGGVFVDGSLYVTAKGSVVRYNPDDYSWTDVASPQGRMPTRLVAVEDELWAFGRHGSQTLDSRLIWISRYDPQSGTWDSDIPLFDDAGSSDPLYDSQLGFIIQPVLWTGSEIVVWRNLGGGLAFAPETQSWREIPAPVPENGVVSITSAVVTDVGLVASLMGYDDGDLVASLARLDGDSWIWLETRQVVAVKSQPTLISAGEWVIWFGPDEFTSIIHVSSGVQYRSKDGIPRLIEGLSVVWTGSQLVVWGGDGLSTSDDNVGLVWTPPASPPTTE